LNTLTNDSDNDSAADLAISGIGVGNSPATFAAVSSGAATVANGAYGILTINANGSYSYEATNNALAANQIVTDIFTYRLADGSATAQITFTVTGVNDAAVIGGVSTGSVTEAGGVANGILGSPNISGALTITDVDSLALIVAQTGIVRPYGTFSIDAAGQWSYALNNSLINVQAIAGGTAITDTITVSSIDGTTKDIVVTINGTNDAAVLSSAVVTLAETNAVLTTNGMLTITDVDSAATFVAQTNVAGTNGVFSINTAGAWTYTANSAFDSLNVGQSVSDTFTVAAADGTTTSVMVTINGSNDAPTISGPIGFGTINDNQSVNSTVMLNLLSGASDIDVGDMLSVTSFSASLGTVTGTTAAALAAAAGFVNVATFNLALNAAVLASATSAGAINFNANTFIGLNALEPGQSVVVNLAYNVSDVAGATVPQTASFTVNGATEIVTGTTAGETLIGSNFGDIISGFGANDSLSGLGGNDTLDGGAGADTLDGGLGTDTVSYATSLIGISLDLTTGIHSDGDTFASIERFVGSALADTMRGDGLNNTLSASDGADTLYGEGGSDTLNGDEGNDILIGGIGTDSMIGGDGSDVYYVESTADVVTEVSDVVATGGYDSVYSSSNFTLSANVEQLLLTTGATIGTGNSGDNSLYATLLFTGANLFGLGGNDVFYGSNYTDSLEGGEGNDIIQAFYSVNGADTLVGGNGDDVYYLFETGDVVIEGAGVGSGFDTYYTQANVTLATNVEQAVVYGDAASATGNSGNNNLFGNNSSLNLTLDGGAGNDSLYGGAGSDTLIGGANDDILFGAGGINTMSGGTGNDQYYSTSATDVIVELAGGGSDTLYANRNITVLAANVENLVSYSGAIIGNGNELDNTLYGNNNSVAMSLDGGAGADLIFGSNSGDVIIGGLGNDMLVGLGGADSFAYTTEGNMGADTINDFTDGFDVIDVRGFGYSFGSNFTVTSAGANTLISFGAGGALDGTTITLAGVSVTNVTAADFLF
jgi:VCBS repeat-containing protein